MTTRALNLDRLLSLPVCLIGLSILALLAFASQAEAAESAAPGWQITSTTYPSHLAPGGKGAILLEPLNVGAASSSGTITIVDELPVGVEATDAGSVFGPPPGDPEAEASIEHSYWECSIAPAADSNSTVTCHNNLVNLPSLPGGAGFPVSATAPRNLQPPIDILVTIAPGAVEGATANHMTMAGGGAPSAVTASDPLVISASPSKFGISRWDGWFSNADGTLDTQAGSVPYSFTTSFDLDTNREAGEIEQTPAGEARNIEVKLPPGLIGNPQAVAHCTRSQFESQSCPRASIIGSIYAPSAVGVFKPYSIFNLVPPKGLAAEFGFQYEGIAVFLVSSVRTGADYGITTRVINAPQRVIIASLVTLWGVSGDPSHASWRCGSSEGCKAGEFFRELGPHPALEPFLRLPTSCGAPPALSIAASDWSDLSGTLTDPLTFAFHDSESTPVGLDGCNRLPFEPTISAKPTTNVADAPTGLDFDLHVPQPEGVKAIEEEVEGEERAVGAEPELHEADLKNARVVLPEGISVNPASANGLEACTPAQIGLTSAPGQTPITTTPAPAGCPDAAKIGRVTIDTPLVDHPIEGGVYVATPEQNPFGSLLALYIAVNDEQTGTVLKLAGKVDANPVTGQLTTTFPEAPQLPFSDFHLRFFEGGAAALRTPQTCGTYQVAGDMTPWSTPEGADAHPGDSFQVTQNPATSSCPTGASQLPSSPSVEAGTLTPKAGAYSPFVLHLARADGTQELTKVETTLPEGLLAKLAGVTDCPASAIAQAESRGGIGQGRVEQEHPSCPPSSEVGKVTVGAGAGPAPYYVSGHAYLAGPYKGAPLSLVIVTPAVAGPYDLGDVVVRTALQVEPLTAQVHAVSDEFPHILQGIPLDVRSINLELDRPSFTLNPTSCAKKSITGSVGALGGASSPLDQPFQVGECKALGFKPKLQLFLQGSTKHAGHPALRAVLTYPKGGAYANVSGAQVNLPHSEFIDQGNLNKTCTKPVLLEGKCPPSTVYGTAKAWTPLLEEPVEGNVYLVGGFGYKLPALVAELNGRIKVLLVGKVDSGKNHGIRNTFEAVPDAPVEKFELQLKGGPKYSLLENSEDLCAAPQKAIADFTAQNGLVDNSKVPMQVKCPKGQKHHAHKKRQGAKSSHRRGR